MGSEKRAQSSSPPPSDDAADASSSKKRKSQVDEIEVDLSLPEPPSKRAKRLLKKGKPLPTKPTSDAEESEDDGLDVPKTLDGKDGAKSKKGGKPERSQFGIWIGNLPWYLTRVDLFKWLVDSSGGMIAESNITRVNLPTQKKNAGGYDSRNRGGENGESNKPQNRGFAYVDFDTENAAVAAMALTETGLGGRKVLIKNSSSFEGRPSAQQQQNGAGGEGGAAADGEQQHQTNGAKKQIPSNKIYVGNLSFQVTEDDLRAHFEKCGEIEWLKVATFEDTGKCKGYGWVKFKEPEAAEGAVRGFVRIREEIETEDDFMDDDGDKEDRDDDKEDDDEAAETGGVEEDEEDEDGSKKEKKKEKKYKMRKWWVNRLHGRGIKVDYAEDDQTRYKKRFGRDAPSREGGGERGGRRGGRGGGRGGRGGRGGGRFGGENGGGEARERPQQKSKEPTYGEEGVASYLTGAVVKSQGKKTTFD